MCPPPAPRAEPTDAPVPRVGSAHHGYTVGLQGTSRAGGWTATVPKSGTELPAPQPSQDPAPHPGCSRATLPSIPPLASLGEEKIKLKPFFCRRQVWGKANCRVITGLYRSRPSIRYPRPADRVQSQTVVDTSGAVTAHVPLYLGNVGSGPSLTSGNKSGNQLLN